MEGSSTSLKSKCVRVFAMEECAGTLDEYVDDAVDKVCNVVAALTNSFPTLDGATIVFEASSVIRGLKGITSAVSIRRSTYKDIYGYTY